MMGNGQWPSLIISLYTCLWEGKLKALLKPDYEHTKQTAAALLVHYE